MAPKTKEQKEAEAAALINNGGNPEDVELSDEELKERSDKINAEREAKAESIRKDREANAGVAGSEKMYSESQVEDIVRRMMAKMKEEGGNGEDIDEEELYAQKKIRLPRFKGKFIVGFKNVNSDEYFPELTIHAFDIWDDQAKRMVAWVTVIFEDKEELTVPLFTVITKSVKVWCDLVETIPTDKSYSNGKVEVSEVKEYSQQGTGVYTKLKVKVNEYKFKIKLPGTGEEIVVGPEVVNW